MRAPSNRRSAASRGASTASQNIAQMAYDAPNIAQVSPSTIANVGAMEMDQSQQINLAQQMEVMQWAGGVKRTFEALETREQKREALRELSDEDLRTLFQYGALKQHDLVDVQPRWRRWFSKMLPHNMFPAIARGAIDSFEWFDENKNAAYRASVELMDEVNEDVLPFMPGGAGESPIDTSDQGLLSRWRTYWNLAKNEPQGDYDLPKLTELSTNNDWNYDTQVVLSRAGSLHRKNYLPSGPEGTELAKQLSVQAINDMVFEGLLEPEEGLSLQDQMTELLDDPEQTSAFADLLASKHSPGRNIAHGLFLDPQKNPWVFTWVSGAFDMAWMMLDPFLAFGKARKVYVAAKHGVSKIDDVVRIATGKSEDMFEALAHQTHQGNMAEAAADWMTANPEEVAPGVRRMAERIQRMWNEDLAATAARAAGETPVQGGGYRQLYKENPALAAYGQDLWQTQIRYEKGLGEAVEVPGIVGRTQRARGAISPEQAVEGIETVVREVGIDAVYRSMFDLQTVRRITQGQYGGHVRRVQTMPTLERMGMARNAVKSAARAQIDWLNDSNYRMLQRLNEKGRFDNLSDVDRARVLARAGSFMGRGHHFTGKVRTWDPVSKTTKLVEMNDLSIVDRINMIGHSTAQVVGTVGTVFTRQMPGDRIFNVMDESAVRQVESLAALLPTQVGDDIVNRFANATEIGERVLIMRGMFAEMFQRNGLFDHKPGQDWAMRFLDQEMLADATKSIPDEVIAGWKAKAGHIYSVDDLDRIAVGGEMESGAAIFGFQTSSSIALPDFRKLFALSRRESFYANFFGVRLYNSKAFEMAISKVWAPAVLMRLGFPLRAGGEEALQFAMREGMATYVRSLYISRVARSRVRAKRIAAGKKDILYQPRGESAFVSTAAMTDGIKLPYRRGNAAVLWTAEMLDRLPWTTDGRFVAKWAGKVGDSRTLLGSAYLGHWQEAIARSTPAQKASWGIKNFHDRWLGDKGLKAIDELIKATDGDYVTRYMGDIASENFGRKFFETQLSGSTSGKGSGVGAAGVGAFDDEQLLREVYDYRWGVFALDSDFGYENYQRFLWQFSHSDDAIDKYFFNKLVEIEQELVRNGMSPHAMPNMIRNRIPEMVEDIATDPELAASFSKMARSAVTHMDNNELVAALRTAPGHSGDSLLPTQTPNGEVLFWHGTRNPLPRDQQAAELLESQQEVQEAVERIHRWRIRSQQDDFYRGELSQIDQVLNETILARSPVITGEFDYALMNLPEELYGQPGMPTRAQVTEGLNRFNAGGIYDPQYWDGPNVPRGPENDPQGFVQSMEELFQGVDIEEMVRRAGGGEAAVRSLQAQQAKNGYAYLKNILETEGDSVRLLRARFAGKLSQDEQDSLLRLIEYRDELSNQLDLGAAQLDDEAAELLSEYGIDTSRLSTDMENPRAFTEAEQAKLEEVGATRERLLDEMAATDDEIEELGVRMAKLRERFGPETASDEMVDSGGETIDELWEQVRRAERRLGLLEIRDRNLANVETQLEAVRFTPGVGHNDLAAIALDDRRYIDSSRGTGGQWWGNGMYATTNLDESLLYSMGLEEGAPQGLSRLYGLGYEGTWNPLHLNEAVPEAVDEAVGRLVKNFARSLPEEQLDNLIALDPMFERYLVKYGDRYWDPDSYLGMIDIDPDDMPLGQEVYRMFDLLRNNTWAQHSHFVGRNTNNAVWVDAVNTFQSTLEDMGYTGFRHTMDGRGMRAQPGVWDNDIIFDSSRIKVLSEWSSADVQAYAAKHADKRRAISQSLELRSKELIMRTHFHDSDGVATHPLTDTLFSDLAEGNVPKAKEIQRLNHAAQSQGADTFVIDGAALKNEMNDILSFISDDMGQPDLAFITSDLMDNIMGRYGMLDEAGDDGVRQFTSTTVNQNSLDNLIEDLDGALVGAGEGATSVREAVEAVARQNHEELWQNVIAPLTRKQKRDMAQMIWARPFRTIGSVIDSISRHPAWFYHYANGLEEMAETSYKYRGAERRLLQLLDDTVEESGKEGAPLAYAQDLTDKLRRFSGDVTVTHEDLTSSMALVNPKKGTVRLDSKKIKDDFDKRLGYMFGEETSTGSRQKAEVMARLGIDRDELYEWFQRRGGAVSYEDFIIQHERAHVALGHKGVHEGSWMSNSAIHQEVEATWAALDNMGGGFLAQPPANGLDIFDLRKMIEDTKAAHKRIQADAVARGGKKVPLLMEDLLQDHPTWGTVRRLIEDSKKVGFKQEPNETLFGFTERVIQRLYDVKMDHIESATKYAFNLTRPHVDSVAISSFGQTLMRNAMPFQWAHERFIKRTINTIIQSPESIRRLHLMYAGMRNIGFVHTDERTGKDYFTYPGTHLAYDGISEVLGAIWGSGLRAIKIQDDAGNEIPDDLDLNEYLRLRGQPYLTIPGLDELGRPILGPQFALLLRYVKHRFPRIAGMETQKISEALVGDIASSPDRKAWQLIVPSVISNIYRANNPYEEMASDSLTALSVLAANDMLPDDQDPSSYEAFNDRLEEQMKIIGWMRVVWGFIGVAPPEIEFEGEGLQADLITALQNYGFEDGMSQWIKQNPDATAWQVFGTKTHGGAPIPATVAVWEFLNDHQELANYKHATAYVVPRPSPGDETEEFYAPAWSQQFGMDLRIRKTHDEMYRAIRYAEVAPRYFEERRQYQEAREIVKGTEQAAQLDYIWARRSLEFRKNHPTFWNELTSNERQLRRNRIVTELNAMVENGDVPVTNSAEATFMLLDGYNRFTQDMDALKGINNREARELRRMYRRNFTAWSAGVVQQMPQGESFYYRVIVPEMSLPDEEIEMIELMAESQNGGL